MDPSHIIQSVAAGYVLVIGGLLTLISLIVTSRRWGSRWFMVTAMALIYGVLTVSMGGMLEVIVMGIACLLSGAAVILQILEDRAIWKGFALATAGLFVSTALLTTSLIHHRLQECDKADQRRFEDTWNW